MSPMRGGKGRWPWVVAAAGLAGLAALLAVTALPLRGKDGLQTSANVGQITGVVIAAVVAAVPLILWARRSSSAARAEAVPAAEAMRRAEAVLADVVEQQWEDEARLRSLYAPGPIPVRWRLAVRTGLMDQADPAEPWTASSADVPALAARFRRLRRRRLVILGGAGTGKTTLAVQLLLELLQTREPGEPVPVLLPAAAWDTTRHPRLDTWLAEQLLADYPALRAPGIGARMVRAMTARGRVLPVLDGLDELPAPARAAIITALNRSLGAAEQLILTSRLGEYRRALQNAGAVISSAAVLTARPLTPSAAADYVERSLLPPLGPSWRHVLAALRAAPAPGTGDAASALAAIAATPLGLWLLRAVYTAPGADPAELTDASRFPSAAALRAHLLDALIPAMIATHEPAKDPAEPFRHSTADTRRWLGYLAHHLAAGPDASGDGQGTGEFAWWRLAATTGAVSSAMSAVCGLAAAVFCGITAGAMIEPWTGLAGGLLCGIIVGGRTKMGEQDLPGYADLRKPPRELVNGIAAMLGFGLVGALVMGGGALLAGSDGALGGGLAGFAAGFGGGFAGFLTAVETPASAFRAVTPTSSLRADRTMNLLRIGASGFLAGALMLLAVAITTRRPGEMAIVSVFATATGAMVATTAGSHRAWWLYALATWRLSRAGLLPRRLMPFLRDCHRLGLLRAVGPLYQFRHAELQAHLAADYRPPI
ncbi:NACHT domain-containing protein [Actinomadura rupiterrae]|uniref:NACHT domain-containing protein n=1 Tax=Actinomadura rupiterrae TaxID=559627 RepID=UPI0020A27363|nr:NACHT domain-containing protein [Actinomadura rupiterrae]MCP2342482.1 hypothetical protein [Actinomadura rupiterrae]